MFDSVRPGSTLNCIFYAMCMNDRRVARAVRQRNMYLCRIIWTPRKLFQRINLLLRLIDCSFLCSCYKLYTNKFMHFEKLDRKATKAFLYSSGSLEAIKTNMATRYFDDLMSALKIR